MDSIMFQSLAYKILAISREVVTQQLSKFGIPRYPDPLPEHQQNKITPPEAPSTEQLRRVPFSILLWAVV